MSPKEIKQMRLEHLNVTQESLAEAIGVSRLVLSHYESGFRRPGPTVRILFYILESQPRKKSLELLELFRKSARKLDMQSSKDEK